jgi:hypothetical protein
VSFLFIDVLEVIRRSMIKHATMPPSSSVSASGSSIESFLSKLPHDMLYLFNDFKMLLISIKAMKEQLYCHLKSKEEFISEVDNCIQALSNETNECSRSSTSCRKSYDRLLCECFIQSAVMIDIHRLNQKISVLTNPRFITR